MNDTELAARGIHFLLFRKQKTLQPALKEVQQEQ